MSTAAKRVGTQDWSSLPDDLLRRIADSFLASNDLDHYMCFRAVCPSWRSATDDPRDRENACDPRFHPRRWIVLDEEQGGELLLLNTNTGRFLHTKLPLLLHEYYLVATTPMGFFVLADRSSPHAACVFNPLTGCLTRFAVPVPPEAGVAEVRCYKDTFLLYLLSDSSRKICVATPQSEDFPSTECGQASYSFLRDAVLGGAYPHISGPALLNASVGFFEFIKSLEMGDTLKLFSGDLPGYDFSNFRLRCFLVGPAAQVFLHLEREGRTLIVLKVNTENGGVEPVESIGAFAIFIGYHRCLTVDAGKFPGVEANCIYHTQHSASSAHISKCNLKEKKVERLSEAAEFVKQDKQFVLVAARPFTIIQLLCNYTMNHKDSELALQPLV